MGNIVVALLLSLHFLVVETSGQELKAFKNLKSDASSCKAKKHNRASLLSMGSALEQRAEHFEFLTSSEGIFPKLQLHVENCSEYPYHGQSEQGLSNVKKDVQKLITQSKQCLSRKHQGRDLPEFVQSKIIELYQLLLAPIDKTMACTFGRYDSFYAISRSGLNPDDEGPNGIYREMPSAPSILVDTNRMAGNFPLGMGPEQIAKFHSFYGERLKGIEVIPGKRNPLIHRIENSASLLFHEMLHWVGLTHFPEDYPDLIYLSQICCFDHQSIDESQQRQACDILYEKNYWLADDKARTQNIKADGVKQLVARLVELYRK